MFLRQFYISSNLLVLSKRVRIDGFAHCVIEVVRGHEVTNDVFTVAVALHIAIVVVPEELIILLTGCIFA